MIDIENLLFYNEIPTKRGITFKMREPTLQEMMLMKNYGDDGSKFLSLLPNFVVS